MPSKTPLNLSREDVDYVKVDFKETGSRFAEYCRHLARLQPGDRILDVDCGLGPLAVALTGYLDSTARYEGIDVVSSGIAWCEQEITSRVPNFRFRLADAKQQYEPRGADFRDPRIPFRMLGGFLSRGGAQSPNCLAPTLRLAGF